MQSSCTVPANDKSPFKSMLNYRIQTRKNSTIKGLMTVNTLAPTKYSTWKLNIELSGF